MWRAVVAVFWLLRRFGVVDQYSVWVLPEATRRLLGTAEAVELFSLGGVTERETAFHGADILGSVVITDAATRRRVLNRILVANRYNIGGMLCLGAEYGVRVRAGETTLDLTFCFDCAKVWVNGPKEYCGIGTTASFPATLFKRILTRAGIPLPPRREH
jgi:hypothetical protein